MKLLLIFSSVFLLGVGGTLFYYPSKELHLAFEDEFEGNLINDKYWSLQTGDGCPDLCGWGNNELQYYTDHPSNVRIEGGLLIMEALNTPTNGYEYSSAKLVSKSKLDIKYGRIEMRAKLPKGKGTWMAFWMLPTKENLRWPLDGEIDIVEHVGYNPGMIYGAIHTGKYNGMYGNHKVDSISIKNIDKEFHEYALEWTENELKWFVDGHMYYVLEKTEEEMEAWPFDQYDYHLILNLAIGGNWGGKHGVDNDVFPQKMEIDYIKYYSMEYE